WLSHLSVTN
ncbi:sensor histidine kinase, GacS/BarA family domain protein, partial [Vibrio parahaemolyticus V-223/04]